MLGHLELDDIVELHVANLDKWAEMTGRVPTFCFDVDGLSCVHPSSDTCSESAGQRNTSRRCRVWNAASGRRRTSPISR